VSVRRSSAQARARSPARTAAAVAYGSAEPYIPPARCIRAKSACTVGAPRRTCEPSMTSSCMSAHAWTSSRAAPIRSGVLGSPPPPAARHPHHTNAVRRRLPPCNANRAIRPATSRPETASISCASCSRASRYSARMASTASTASQAVPGTSSRARSVWSACVARVMRVSGMNILSVCFHDFRALRKRPMRADAVIPARYAALFDASHSDGAEKAPRGGRMRGSGGRHAVTGRLQGRRACRRGRRAGRVLEGGGVEARP